MRNKHNHSSQYFAFCIVSLLIIAACRLGTAPRLYAQDTAEVATGVRLLEEGSVEAAEELLRALVETHPADYEAHHYLARALFAGEEFDAALEQFERAVELSPSNADYRLWFGRTHIEIAQRAGILRRATHGRAALNAFQEAVELDPASVGAREWLARYYWNAPVVAGGNKAEAQKQVDVVRELDSSAGHRLMGRFLSEDGQTEKALREYRSLLAADSAGATAHDWLMVGRLREKTGKYASALQAYEQVITLDPNNEEAGEALESLRARSIDAEQ